MRISRTLAAITTALLITSGLTGCNGDGARTAEAAETDARTDASNSEASAPQLSGDFEGTLQQIEVALGANAIRSIAGTDDPSDLLELEPETVLEAVHSGRAEAQMIRETTLAIDGEMARTDSDDGSTYTIVDGEDRVAYLVDPSERMIMVMDPAEMEAVANAQERDLDEGSVERIGQRTIRGYEATGYRMRMGDRVMIAWMSDELGGPLGSYYDFMFELGSHLQKMGMGPQVVPPEGFAESGAAVRLVMIDTSVLGGSSRSASPFGGMMPAYSVTEFYDLQPGDVPDARFELPEGFQRQSMAEMMGRMGDMMDRMGEMMPDGPKMPDGPGMPRP